MFIITHKKIFISIAALMVIASCVAIFVKGFAWGIDFTGGTLTEVTYEGTRPDVTTVGNALADAGISGARVQPAGEKGLIVRTPVLGQGEQATLQSTLQAQSEGKMTVEQANSIGPTIGKELRSKAWIAIAIALLAITAFIAYSFRASSEVISSWKYGAVAIIMLLHDIIIPTGIFAALGYELDSLFIIALLAILGRSIVDTIVVFDRIRENLKRKTGKDLLTTVGASISQTFTRSINTSMTVLIVLVALYVVGPEATKHFTFALILGMIFGTFSSICVASPLLTIFAGKRG
jgi:preprotein translocase subunit SecF